MSDRPFKATIEALGTSDRPFKATIKAQGTSDRRSDATTGREEAERLYGEAGSEVKTAIDMACCSVPAAAARARLAATGGHVRRAITGGSGVDPVR